jgi:rod shape determining protein RodA
MHRFRIDLMLVIPQILLILISLLVLYSVMPQLIINQMIFVFLATIAFIIFSNIDYEIIFSLHIFSYVFLILLTLTTFIFGIVSRGSQRWLQLGLFNLQASELIKPFLLVTFSVILASRISNKFLWLCVAGLIPVVIIYFQPDLGTSLVIIVGWLSLALSRLSLKKIFIFVFLGLVCAFPLSKYVLHDYQRQRIYTFLNPYSDPLNKGYHVVQSIISVGSGELLGRGLGRGTQTGLKFLPEYHTDFIFASLSEELGFVCSSSVIFLYGIVFWRIYKISQNCSDLKASYFCLASLALLGFQTFINIAMNLGLAPITGITLPLMSYGGSSLMAVAINLGILHSISQKNIV